MKDINSIIHEDLKDRFNSLLICEPVLRDIIYEVLTIGGVYILGGYVRDVIYDKENRDLDIIVDISPEQLYSVLNNNKCNDCVNRLGGVKLRLDHIDVDIWSINNNWAFINNLVKLNENDKLQSIAKGCFYNYDALVVSVPKFLYNIRYYKEFVEKKELDIIQRKSSYKKLNPTVEANIIRATYIKKLYSVSFSDNLRNYLTREILALKDKYGDVINRLMMMKQFYPKYDFVLESDLKAMIKDLFDNNRPSLFDLENIKIIRNYQ